MELARRLVAQVHRATIGFQERCAQYRAQQLLSNTEAGGTSHGCRLGPLVALASSCTGIVMNGLQAAGPTAAVDSFIETERPIALQGVLNNIGPNGSMVVGAAPGCVVASPSREDPDCMRLAPLLLPPVVSPLTKSHCDANSPGKISTLGPETRP